jgi:hypothetical protein
MSRLLFLYSLSLLYLNFLAFPPTTEVVKFYSQEIRYKIYHLTYSL